MLAKHLLQFKTLERDPVHVWGIGLGIDKEFQLCMYFLTLVHSKMLGVISIDRTYFEAIDRYFEARYAQLLCPTT